MSRVVDEKKKVARVTYLPAQTDLSKMELAVARVGYDANDTKADVKAYADLPGCCKLPDKK